MIEYLQFFLKPAHLFNVRPQAMSARAITILAIIFGLFVIFGLINKMAGRKTKDGLKAKAFKRLWYLGITSGCLGYVYLAFAWQGVALLAARFWLLIILAVVIVWLFFIAKYLYIEAPKLRKNIDQKRDFEKYIP
jgi:small-conductance mechanosensitive channel